MRVLRVNPSIPAERASLAHLADVSNYAISTPGLTEQVRTVKRMAAEGYRIARSPTPSGSGPAGPSGCRTSPASTPT